MYSHKSRAMIVDDDTVSRHYLARSLQLNGFQVYETGQYEVAIRTFIALKPSIIFLDQKLHSLNGLEVAFFIRRLTGGGYTSIYLHTTVNESDLKKDKNFQFIDGYICKGDTVTLQAVINQHMESSQPAGLVN